MATKRNGAKRAKRPARPTKRAIAKAGVTVHRKIERDIRGAMAIVPYSEIVKPEMYKGSMTLVPTPMTELQIKAIVAPTPAHIVKQRPGKGGGTWDYVPGWWFKKKANFVFGFAHDFEIISERIDGDFITVKGKVTVRHPKTGKLIATKTDFGGAAIKFKKDMAHKPENYLDIANDFKAAATDAFKRCMVQFGFAMDIYGKGESLDEGIIVQNDQPKAPDSGQGANQAPTGSQAAKTGVVENPLPEYACEECANPLTRQEAEYSKKMFKRKGKPVQLCRSCQKIYKDNKWF